MPTITKTNFKYHIQRLQLFDTLSSWPFNCKWTITRDMKDKTLWFCGAEIKYCHPEKKLLAWIWGKAVGNLPSSKKQFSGLTLCPSGGSTEPRKPGSSNFFCLHFSLEDRNISLTPKWTEALDLAYWVDFQWKSSIQQLPLPSTGQYPQKVYES